MKRSTILFIFIGLVLASSAVNHVQGFSADTILVKEAVTDPVIDGSIGLSEWDSDKLTQVLDFSNFGFDEGPVTEITITIVALRNITHVFFLVQFELNINTGYETNASVGIALSNNNIAGMDSVPDRKVIYHNSSNDETGTFDLNFCSTCPSGGTDQRPGQLDENGEGFSSKYGNDTGLDYFEIAFPLIGVGPEDVNFEEGTFFKIVINPFKSLFHETIGHGGIATSELEVVFSSKSLFERPEGPMDALSKIFTGLFSFIIIGMSLLLLVSARNDRFAEKFLRVNITEKMANESILMEIGYYNSSFVSLFSLFYFWLLALITVVYGWWWANWGLDGLLINGPALILSTYTMYDLVRRNHNPQDIPEEERRNLGREVEETNALWIFPPLFLGLVLFMLVFIGIDVIT